MTDKSQYFLDYNIDNVMKHVLAIEDHLRNLESNYNPEHASCLVKHSFQAEEQCDEGISHASEVSPKKVHIFKQIKKDTINFRKKLENEENPIQLINDIREIRRDAEKLNPMFSLEKCNLCNPNVEKYLKFSDENDKDLNIDKTNNINIESNGVKSMKKIALIGGSQFVGIGVREVGGYIDTAMGKTASPAFERPSTWIDIGGGLLMAVLPQFMKVGETLTTVLTIVGTQRLADRIISLAKEYTVPTAAYRRIVPTISQGMGRPIAVGGLVTVD